jgi:hypothetical protein
MLLGPAVCVSWFQVELSHGTSFISNRGNQSGAVKAVDNAHVTIHNNVTFTNNLCQRGGGAALVAAGDSKVRLMT